MNRNEIVGAVPALQQFGKLAPLQKKETVECFVGLILDALAHEGREPDEWEALDLASVLGFIACGWYSAAATAADRALTPVEDRAPAEEQPAHEGPIPTLRDLQRGHHYVCQIPLQVG